ncbi:hypothetical protein [Micrococcus sp.]|uniref:hypothetical protein n=1 Tax=Micrococcus sp. TaxID=1271 RepID=UPI0026DC0EE3|nr:hypothetical protein [Micrococcus sp.]MDO4239979.1 hypothetical protein [Micrococcus sp.]
MTRGDLEVFFAELSAFERAQDAPVVDTVSVQGYDHVLLGTRKGHVRICLPTSRLSIWSDVDACAPAWTRRPPRGGEPPIPAPGDPHVGWVELLYDLRYLYPLEDFGPKVLLECVRRGGESAWIDLSSGGVPCSSPIDLLEFMGVSAVMEDCVLHIIGEQSRRFGDG